MAIFEQRETIATLRHYSSIRITFEEIGQLCQELSIDLSKCGSKNFTSTELLASLTKTGQLLWDYLLTAKVKEKLKSSRASDLIISIDEELISIPWEILYDGNNFLCLNFNIGRFVHTKDDSFRPQYRSLPNVLRMLILANPTNDLRSAYVEGVEIRNQFDRKRESVQIDFKSTCIDKLYVKKNICEYDLVHFAGHCEYDPRIPANSGWVLADTKFTVQDILNMGHSVPFPPLVFSNACHSAKVDTEEKGVDYQESNYNMACAFLFSGVRHYIGTICKIEDKASLDFSREFYAHLINGVSVGESVRLARLNLIRQYGIENIYWAGYLLYGNPNFVLFKDKGRPGKSKILTERMSKGTRRILLIVTLAAVIFLIIYLSLFLPTLNPATYVRFRQLNKHFYTGKNALVISMANEIIRQEPDFLAVYPLLGDTYYKMGKRETALKYYFDYARLSEKKSDRKNLSEAYLKIGWFYQLGKDYVKAADFYNRALSLAQKNQDKLHEAAALRKLAVWHIDKKDYVQALEFLTKSSAINREREYLPAYRYNLACDYFDIGLLFVNKNDFSTAKVFYEKSCRLFERLKAKNELSDCCFNLGEVYLYEKEFQKALDYYMSGLMIDQVQGNKMNLAGDYNMIGELYAEMDNTVSAEEYFKQAILSAKETDNPLEAAAAYRNLGFLYKKIHKKDKAREYLRQAQEIYYSCDRQAYEEIKKELLELSEI
ncbi:MAG: CHAT domain-containing protein [Candidatus Omnitrophica bacterium]|nr:CHAT domain-containing protein [Candidatus Omnitrophota bacterium]